MKMLVSLFVVFAFASSVLGECPVPPTTPGADIGKISGRWYQTIKVWPQNLTVVTMDFTPREDGGFNITTRVPFSKFDEFEFAERTDNQNVLNITDPHRKTQFQITFNIADTDYDNYLAGYFCLIYPFGSFPNSRLILSRTETMNADKYAELTDLVNKIGVSND